MANFNSLVAYHLCAFLVITTRQFVTNSNLLNFLHSIIVGQVVFIVVGTDCSHIFHQKLMMFLINHSIGCYLLNQ